MRACVRACVHACAITQSVANDNVVLFRFPGHTQDKEMTEEIDKLRLTASLASGALVTSADCISNDSEAETTLLVEQVIQL